MRVLLFGTGDYYKRYRKWFDGMQVLALLDNNEEKWGKYQDSELIISPKEGIKTAYERIYILSVYTSEIHNQLLELGVPDEKIYFWTDLNKELGQTIVKKNITIITSDQKDFFYDKEQTILLLSFDMHLNGASMALYYAACALQDDGVPVVVGTPEGGSVNDLYRKRKIPLIIDSNLQIETMQDAEWICGFKAVLCNTVNYYLFLSKRDLSTKVIWWLHDGALYYESLPKDVLSAISDINLYVYAVGPIATEAFRKNVTRISQIKNLLYGLPEFNITRRKHDKMTFTVVGSVQKRKGQDIFVDAVSLLDRKHLDKAKFLIVGDDTSLYAQQLKTKASSEHINVIFTGEKNRSDLEYLYGETDVCVCPSREDPMPITVTEGLMNCIPCIISSNIGTSEYIRNGENGFVLSELTPECLARCISNLIDAPEHAVEVGRRGRKIYEDKFSLSVFENNIRKTLLDCLY